MMNDDNFEFLTELLETPSPSGFEMEAQRLWADHLKQYTDDVQCDAYGNTWATFHAKNEEAPTLLIEAHADEIGFMIRHITSEGFLRIERVGGTDIAIARGRRIRFQGSQGEIFGITGNTAIHLRDADEKAPKTWDIYVDVGADSDKEVETLGLRVGHVGVYCDGPMMMNDKRIVCRALDNRIGGFILSEVARQLAKSKTAPSWNISLVNAVQEEVGGCGASMITHRLRPEAAICLDVTHATDTPGLDKGRYGDIKLGKGPSLSHGTANHPNIVTRLELVADKKEISIQHEAVGRYTGTDTDSMYISRNGVASALISLPLRYMHSPVETADMTDIQTTIDLICAFIKSLKKDDHFGHQL
ncbi:MAG: M42 family metallopeptidase [Akkermansia sp.]